MASRGRTMVDKGAETARYYYLMQDWNKFYARFSELHGYIIKRMHGKLDYAKVAIESPACLPDKQYWEGFNAGLDWAHRILDGDKSAD